MLCIILCLFSLGWSNDYWLEFGVVASRIEQISIIYGFKLFVMSEFFLFVSAFAGYINLRLNLSNFGLFSLFPLFATIAFSLPFSNLFILLTSGLPLSSSQIFSKCGNLELYIMGLVQTLGASFLFIALQLKEFTYSYFSLYDNILGSIFYFTVGLHGSHVMVGSIIIYFVFLALSLSISISNCVDDAVPSFNREEGVNLMDQDSCNVSNDFIGPLQKGCQRSDLSLERLMKTRERLLVLFYNLFSHKFINNEASELIIDWIQHLEHSKGKFNLKLIAHGCSSYYAILTKLDEDNNKFNDLYWNVLKLF